MVLSDLAIREAREHGDLIIEPFVPANLNTSSYDVTLGEWFYRESRPSAALPPVYNIYDPADVQRVWGEPRQARTYAELAEAGELPRGLTNIADTDRVLALQPGETVLAHTREFIGGVRNITTKMQARSSLGRNFIEVCKCAGFGDVGFANIWVMEITNNSQHHTIPLVVGLRVAQIVFFQTPPAEGTYRSKYQPYAPQDAPQRWEPSVMLPKLHLDREIEGRK